jgi:molybdopterin-guanine dinucleotide biosynthesis protein A
MEVLENVEAGKRRVQSILQALEGFWMADVAKFADPVASERWLTNVNTPNELALAEKP